MSVLIKSRVRLRTLALCACLVASIICMWGSPLRADGCNCSVEGQCAAATCCFVSGDCMATNVICATRWDGTRFFCSAGDACTYSGPPCGGA